MKISAVFLGASLVANAILFGVFFLPTDRAAPGSAGFAPSTSSAAAVPGGSPAAVNASSAKAASSSAPLANAALVSAAARLDPEDMAGIIAWLRASGFPPRAVAGIISRLVGKRFQEREAVLNEPADQPFWKNSDPSSNNPKIASERIKLQREQLDFIKQLFGGKMMDYYSDSEEARVMLRRQMGDLPPEKLNSIASIEQDYALLAQELRVNARGLVAPSPADLEKLAVLEKEHRADIAKLLTPEELLDFQMHYSPTSSRMRRELALFKPSEAEYRALFPILDTIEQQFPSNLGSTEDTAAARRAAEEKLQDQITAVLGADRYQQFKQSTDPANYQINRLITRLDLPLDAAVGVAAIRTEMQQRAAEIRQNQQLDSGARNAQLAALAEEAAGKLSRKLGGSRGLDAYKEYGGQWLTSLVPRQPAGKN